MYKGSRGSLSRDDLAGPLGLIPKCPQAGLNSLFRDKSFPNVVRLPPRQCRWVSLKRQHTLVTFIVLLFCFYLWPVMLAFHV